MRLKKLTAVILLVILILSVPVTSFAAKTGAELKPTNDFFVNDFADVISSSDKAEIMSIATDLYRKTTAQVVVVTLESLNGNMVDDYALYLGREWGVGSKEKNNGVVILLSVGDREITVQVGYGLEGALNDAKCGRFIDNYAVPYLKNNNYSLGLKELFKAVAAVVFEEYGAEPEDSLGSYTLSDDGDEYYELSPVSVIAVVAVVIFILIICRIFHIPIFRILRYLYISEGNNRRGGSSHGGGYHGGSSHGGGYHGGGGSFGGGGASRKF